MLVTMFVMHRRELESLDVSLLDVTGIADAAAASTRAAAAVTRMSQKVMEAAEVQQNSSRMR